MNATHTTNRKTSPTVKTNPVETTSVFSSQAKRRAKERRTRERIANATSTNRADRPSIEGIGPSTY